MRLAHRLRQLDRIQKAMVFRWSASAVVVALTLGVLGWLMLNQAAEARAQAGGAGSGDQALIEPGGGADGGAIGGAGSGGEGGSGGGESEGRTAAQRAIDTMLSAREDVTGRVFGTLVVGGVALAVVWLGLGLTYLGLALGAVALVYPLRLLGASTDWLLLVGGVITLTGAFTALMQGLREAFSLSNPVFAVARNVLAEAVRMKLSIVFIVMLVIGLSGLPSLLDEGEELRYRVQSFLQYGTGGAFWIIALLTVLFSVASVTFEQRDRLIWQTATKPVAAWQYVLGKWIGVVGLSGVLLGVSASGVFLMVDYLRSQEALGEVAPYTPENENTAITEDRLLLESQVLTARRSAQPEPPISRDDERFRQGVDEFIATRKQQDPSFQNIEDDDEKFQEVVDDLYKSATSYARQVEPGRMREFVFEGLAPARGVERPLTLAYKVSAPGARPSNFYELLFEIEGERAYRFRKDQVAVDTTHSLMIPNDAVSGDGTMRVRVLNAGMSGGGEWRTFSFTPDGLTLSYSVGGFHANYLRAVLVLWLKLALLSMLAICLSTFLSFPVACLVGLTALVAAEATAFLTTALETYSPLDREGNVQYHKLVINWVATAITGLFRAYSDLRPTTRLVEGRVLTWANMGLGLSVLGGMAAAFYGLGVLIFRNRELATYSGG